MTSSHDQDALARRAELDTPLGRFRRMYEIRSFEERVLQLFFEGHIDGTTHTCQGQEAVAVGVASVLRITDTVACTYRGHGHALALGVPPERVLGEIVGRTSGCMGGLGGSMHLSDRRVGLLPTFAIVGAGIPIAAGVGLRNQIRGTDDIGVAVFGDGAANIGAFHEALNLAGIWQLPTVFICENNHYGEYSRIDRTTPIKDIADRAASYGMPGEVVDGQVVGAVMDAVGRAADRARSGGGPTLIEAKTYRYAGHSRSDKGAYRPEGELESWMERDPIELFRSELLSTGQALEEDLEEVAEAVSKELHQIEKSVLSAPKPDRMAMFNHIYATPM